MKQGLPRYWTCSLGLVFGGLLLGVLPGCVRYVDRPRGEVYVAPVVVMEDDYVYYPDYEVYYSNRRHQYAYRDGRNWVMRPAPRGVSVNVLVASPSVSMTFHDSPGNHHAETARQYPKHWAPPNSEGRPGQPGNPRDQHGNHHDNRDNHGK